MTSEILIEVSDPAMLTKARGMGARLAESQSALWVHEALEIPEDGNSG
jgi:hypothetical protein